MTVLEKIRQGGFVVVLDKNGCIEICGSLNDRQRMWVWLHRWALIQALEAEKCQRNVIRYKFKHNGGGGVWITDVRADEAEKALLDRFPGKEIEMLALLN